MSTEITTWILFWINAFQFYYFICAFMKAKIKNYYVGASIYAAICLFMRAVSNLFEGDAYSLAILFVSIFQSIIVYPLFHVKKWYYPWLMEIVLMGGNLLLQIPVIWLCELVTGSNVLLEGNNSDFDLNYIISSSLMCMLFMIAVFFAYEIMFLREYKMSKELIVSTMGIVLYQTMVISLYYALCRNSNEIAINSGVIFVLFSILSDMAVLKSIERVLEKQQTRREWEQLLLQRQKEYEYYVDIQQVIEEMRMERHDCANYLQTIEGMIKNDNTYVNAKKFILELKMNKN